MGIDRIGFISRNQAMELVTKYHYSLVMPRINKYFIGAFENGKLVGVLTLGWGVNPVHTIRKLFPSLSTPDYYEIGKLCLADHLPKNTASYFVKQVIQLIKKEMPWVKVLFSWADGIMGKPGYVYQSCNFFYGGFIWTNHFLDQNNVRVHKRTFEGIVSKEGEGRGSSGFDNVLRHGYRVLYGKQFRYLYPICNKREWKRLLRESDYTWERGNYPKDRDIELWIKDKDGKRKVGKIELARTTYTKNTKHERLGQMPLF